MAVVARSDTDGYRPEFSSVVIRDALIGEDIDDAGTDSPALDEDAGPLWGDVARAGEGWLQLQANDAYQRISVEAHDGEPAPESNAWRDELETPYFCLTGSVGLSSTTGGPAQSGIRIGTPGHYRARVCRRGAADQGYDWAVRLWRADVALPAWRTRDATAVTIDGIADDIFALVSWSPAGRFTATMADLARSLLVSQDKVREALEASEYLSVSGSTTLTVETSLG